MNNLIRFDHAANRLRTSGRRPKSAWTMALISRLNRANGIKDYLAEIDRDLANRKLALAMYLMTNEIERGLK